MASIKVMGHRVVMFAPRKGKSILQSRIVVFPPKRPVTFDSRYEVLASFVGAALWLSCLAAMVQA